MKRPGRNFRMILPYIVMWAACHVLVGGWLLSNTAKEVFDATFWTSMAFLTAAWVLPEEVPRG